MGDIHGRADLLDRLLEKLHQQAPPDARLICVGDYVDRGEESARTLRDLHALTQQHPDHVICLMGNHEEMLLNFLDAPAQAGPSWLRHGGLQTLASFGLPAPAPGSSGATPDTAAWEDLRDRLRAALGPDLETWLRALPLRWSSGNVTVVHAGADPALPLEAQPAQALLWGHRDFTTTPRSDGHWVLHGHTITDAPQVQAGRIAIDTGAYATGRLTAALLEPGSPEPRFIIT
ncbi:MAG: metallophosphoesterase family protein [Celeribacter sp.]